MQNNNLTIKIMLRSKTYSFEIFILTYYNPIVNIIIESLNIEEK